MTEKTINLRGLKCPLPALRARKALTGLKPGDLLIAECTDPLTAIDIPNLSTRPATSSRRARATATCWCSASGKVTSIDRRWLVPQRPITACAEG